MKKVRKSITALMLAIVMVFTVIPAMASAKTVQEQSVFVNGVKVKYAQPPITINGTTMVSARETIESLGLSFTWDKANKRIIGSNGEMTVVMMLGQYTGVVNGASVFLGSPAVERGGRIMVPLRFLVDSMGAVMEAKNGRISIKDNSKTKSKYYTGLPLQITNTYVKNLSQSKVTVHFVNYFYADGQLFPERNDVTIAKGKKGVFTSSALNTGDQSAEDEELIFFGRVIEYVSIDGKEIPNKSFGFVEDAYYDDKFKQSISDMYKRMLKEAEQEQKAMLKQELVKNNYVPLKFSRSQISYNSIGYPEADISFRNVTEKTIVSFELTFDCYDAYGDKVNHLFGNSNRFKAMASQTDMKSGASHTFTWSLDNYYRTAKISNIKVNKVAFSDGTVWKRK
ncbi:copper amine oxidase N-terminal domain-containing protein [Paenibacillaceae bacterium]|nr:copper amine oxidase N-terminal domain-containing protein [Paenibacillaceae bacterium]